MSKIKFARKCAWDDWPDAPDVRAVATGWYHGRRPRANLRQRELRYIGGDITASRIALTLMDDSSKEQIRLAFSFGEARRLIELLQGCCDQVEEIRGEQAKAD